MAWGEQGRVTGFSVASFLQLVSMEEKTCKLGILSQDKRKGDFYFDNGRLFHAFYEGVKGEEAAMAMLRLNDMEISLQSLPDDKPETTIQNELMSIIINSSIAEDHHEARIRAKRNGKKSGIRKNCQKQPVQAGRRCFDTEGEGEKGLGQLINGIGLADIKRKLQEFKNIEGFMSVGVFTPHGEMVAEYNTTGQKLAQLGALANELLLASQKATEIMNVGRGNMIHVETSKAQMVALCLNEATDFTVTKKGNAHIHMVLVMEKVANVVIGKMKLKGVVEELAAAFR